MADRALATSAAERARLGAVSQVEDESNPRKTAAARLDLCARQARRLARADAAQGDAGLVSRPRGRVWNRRLGGKFAPKARPCGLLSRPPGSSRNCG